MSGGSKLTKITDGAVSFDGTGDFYIADSADFELGSGDFTIECFAYTYTDSGYIISKYSRQIWYLMLQGFFFGPCIMGKINSALD